MRLCKRCGAHIQKRRRAGTSKHGWRAATRPIPWDCWLSGTVPRYTGVEHEPEDLPIDLTDPRAVERWLRA